MEKLRNQNRKKIILSLRWTVIIVTSYLILLDKGSITEVGSYCYLFVVAYILTNVVLTFLPGAWFSNLKLFYFLSLFDIGFVSLGMYLSQMVTTTDFYLVFFLIIILASISRNYKLLVVISGIIALIYGYLLYLWGLLGSESGVGYALRIPFIFIMSCFYGYIVQTFLKEKKRQFAVSEGKFRALFEHSYEGIIILKDSEFKISHLNREAERLTAHRRGDLVQRTVFDLFRPWERDKALHFLEEVAQKGGGRTDSLPLMRKDGTPVEVDLSIKRIDLGEETYFQVIFRDLTSLRILEKKIRENKRNLEAILDGIQDRISLVSPDYQILRVNKAVIEKHNSGYKELVGKKCFEAYYQRSLPCEKCPLTVTLQTRQASSSILRVPGLSATEQIFSYPISNEEGNMISIIIHYRDITQEQQLQEQLIRSEKLAGLGILTSGISHEINNPLSGVIGMAEIGLEEDDPFQIQGYFKDILNCGQRIQEITKGLSSYSKTAKTNEQTLVDIQEALESSLKMAQMSVKNRWVEVVKTFQPVQRIEADLGEIQLVFNHLITNAFQAIRGDRGRIILSISSSKDSVQVKVGDNGIGIPSKHLKKIFDPFFTTKTVGEGKGLGLNIAYRIITKYEGTIDVESDEGSGTTFSVEFPVRRGQE